MKDSVVERIAQHCWDREHSARVGVYYSMIDQFRAGIHGSSIPDMVKINELEFRIKTLEAALEAVRNQTP